MCRVVTLPIRISRVICKGCLYVLVVISSSCLCVVLLLLCDVPTVKDVYTY